MKTAAVQGTNSVGRPLPPITVQAESAAQFPSEMSLVFRVVPDSVESRDAESNENYRL